MKVDVAIVTKNRYPQLQKCVSQLQGSPYVRSIVVVDSTNPPDTEFVESLGVNAVYTPDVSLGKARDTALRAMKSPVVMFVDDDITLAPEWFPRMTAYMRSHPDVWGVSSKIVYGWQTDKTLEKLHMLNLRKIGGSVGICLLRRQAILALGGFNIKLRRGEDAELHNRIRLAGGQWNRENSAVAYHNATMREYWQRPLKGGMYFLELWRQTHNKVDFMLRYLASALVMPWYYGMVTLDLRAVGAYAVYKWYKLLLALYRLTKLALQKPPRNRS